MDNETVVILGRLPWEEATPLRIGRWAELLRVRPVADTPSGAFPALLAAHHALTGRVARVVLADPAKADAGAVARAAGVVGLVVVTDAGDGGELVGALVAELDGAPEILAAASVMMAAELATRTTRVVPEGLFTPPGHTRAWAVDGVVLAAPLVVGTAMTLGPWAALPRLLTADEMARATGAGAHVLTSDHRGAVRLLRAPGKRFERQVVDAEREPESPRNRADAMAMAALKPELEALVAKHGLSGGSMGVTKKALERDLAQILNGAKARGLIVAWTAELPVEDGQLVVDVRVKTAKRVEAVVLRVGSL